MDFFKHPERMGDCVPLLYDCLIQVFSELFDNKYRDRNQMKKMKSYESLDKHPLVNKILEYAQNSRVLDGENSKCDEIFADYIVRVCKVANKDTFCKVLKYVILFRESLNIINAEKTKDEKEYSETYNAEDAPDISNEFVTEFLETDTNMFDIPKEEAIDLTQNFCQWLYDNNFTCSKLSLISNYS